MLSLSPLARNHEPYPSMGANRGHSQHLIASLPLDGKDRAQSHLWSGSFVVLFNFWSGFCHGRPSKLGYLGPVGIRPLGTRQLQKYWDNLTLTYSLALK